MNTNQATALLHSFTGRRFNYALLGKNTENDVVLVLASDNEAFIFTPNPNSILDPQSLEPLPELEDQLIFSVFIDRTILAETYYTTLNFLLAHNQVAQISLPKVSTIHVVPIQN